MVDGWWIVRCVVWGHFVHMSAVEEGDGDVRVKDQARRRSCVGRGGFSMRRNFLEYAIYI